MLSLVFVTFVLAGFSNGLSTVMYGPKNRELLFVAAKVAAKEEIETSCVCAPGSETLARKLMYGAEYSENDVDEPGRAKPISSGEDMQNSLEQATSLCLISYDEPLEKKAVNTLIEAAGDGLSKVVLLSKMGVTKAGGGFFGGGDSKLLESENGIRELCKSKDLELSIVRAGILKGGGPGKEGEDIGLDRSYYNTLIDVVEASVTMAHDKFALGAEVTKGDLELPNMFTLMGKKSSFEASPFDTNRAVVAGAVAACLVHEGQVEFSVGTAKAESPPTTEEWSTLLSNL